MRSRHRRGLRMVPGHLILLVLVFTALFPIALVFLNSLKTAPDVVRNPLGLPSLWDWPNYVEAWQYGNFGTGFINSFLLTGTTVIVVLFTAAPAAYVLSERKIRAATPVMIYLMMAMTVPIQLFLFPLYAAFARLGLLSNVFAVAVVIAAINLPLATLLLMTFFMGIPKSLPEAARIDGASTVQVLRHILMPAISPGLITVGVIVGLNAWNEYLISVTFLQDESSYTATLGFLSLTGTFAVDQGVLMAGAALLILPITIIFLFAQRQFIDGLVTGSVKE